MDVDHYSPRDSMDAIVERAYQASLSLATTKGEVRSRGVQAIAEGIQQASDEILEANTLDLEVSKEMAVPELLLEWLKLTPERLQDTVQLLQRLGELSDPLQWVMNAPYQLNPSQTYCQLTPLGVIALIYEAFPELAAIAAGLCIKTGNSLILRGGAEASHSSTILAQVMQNALTETGLPPSSVEVLHPEQGSSISDLVTQDQMIRLIIPYGRSSLVQQVTQQATTPVLRVAMGNCALYWSPGSDLDLVRSIIIDSHSSEPDPVNAIEKVLIHQDQKPTSFLRLLNSLQDKGFQLRGDAQLTEEFPEHLVFAEESEWKQAYLDKIVAFKRVNNLEEAIFWINRHSSGHADCLVTDSYQESHQFSQEVNSALIYINSSPRFYRNPKRGESVFLGMSNQKGHRCGLIGLKNLTTLKQVVQGEGRV